MIDYSEYLINNKSITRGRVLGQGKFGEVSLAVANDLPFKECVIRSVNNSAYSVNFMREIDVYIKIRHHPSILKFYGYCIDPKFIIIEYMPNKSLQDIFDRLSKGYATDCWTPTMRSKTIFGLCVSLLHIHSQNATHRYLTPSCVLYDSNWEMRLSDFGFAKINVDCSPNNTILKLNYRYSAPETLASGNYDRSVDFYSYAVIINQIISEQEPFGKLGEIEVMGLIGKGEVPTISEKAPKFLANIIDDIFHSEPEDRPDFVTIVKALLDYEGPLIPGTDMDEYDNYRQRMMKNLRLSDEDQEYISTPKIKADDIPRFEEALRKADEENDKKAQVSVARMYSHGFGVERDYTKAFEYYQKAAENGEISGMYKLSNLYATGTGCVKDESKSIELLGKAADKGLSLALLDYGVLLFNGYFDSDENEILKRDIEKAKDFFLKALKIDPYCQSEPQFRLAQYYELKYNECKQKRGKTKDDDDVETELEGYRKEAMKYYRMASANGLEMADVEIARIFYQGEICERDVEEAVKIYTKCANKNIGVAAFNLGTIYSNASYAKKDDKKAREFFQKAAELNDPNGMVQYGKILFRADKNDYNASLYFEKAAKMGSPEGQHSWGTFLIFGYGGTTINIEEGLEYLQLAAKQGFAPSLERLGDFYMNGNNVDRDVDEARRLYQRAAHRGSKTAQAKLDKM